MIFKTISHEKVLRKLFGAKCAYDGRMVFNAPLMLIGFTNRCGSNLLADYLRAARAATFFGLEPPETLPKPGLTRQADAVNADFIDRYLKDVLQP
jgi:hypothetical protein